MFGPYHKEGGGQDVLVTLRDSAEDFIKKVDNFRSEEIYKHDDCTGKDFFMNSYNFGLAYFLYV